MSSKLFCMGGTAAGTGAGTGAETSSPPSRSSRSPPPPPCLPPSVLTGFMGGASPSKSRMLELCWSNEIVSWR